MADFVFTTKDYILYLLEKMGGDGVDKIKLNKVAFFVEFGYILKKQRELSTTQYAGITLGPVVNDYQNILELMAKEGKLTIENNKIRTLKKPATTVPKEVMEVVDPLIEKYKLLTNTELVSLSHLTDSYNITTLGEKRMGKIIDKKLAYLETFFEETDSALETDQDLLPVVPRKGLRAYGKK